MLVVWGWHDSLPAIGGDTVAKNVVWFSNVLAALKGFL